jgi:ParB family chromosome partitioning protein
VEREFREIALEDLGQTWGPKPAERLVENIRDNGIIVPVVVAEVPDEDGEITYQLIDGNRRVAAARLAGLTTVPAQVIRGFSPAQLAQVTVLANSMRATNPVTEWWALDELVQAGSRPDDLARITGLSKSTLQNRMALADLDPRIFEGLARGEVPPVVAMAASRLPREIQDRLGETFADRGFLRKRDVDAAAAMADGAAPEEAGEADTADDLAGELHALATRAIASGMTDAEWRSLAIEAFVAVQAGQE